MKEPKKTYVKPEITRVELVAEEAVLAGGCKGFSGETACISYDGCGATIAGS